MHNRINKSSPVPLYHQIAEALRNAIAVGELASQEQLPPVRQAASAWGVNLHTVRKAYGELAREGLVLVDGARGTRVVGAPTHAGVESIDAFIASCSHTAREKFGLTQTDFGRLLLKHAAGGAPPPVYVLECSRTQAEGHCDEIMRAWRVRAAPIVLGEIDELPRGLLLATYFHYNDIRQRWPDRLEEIRFMAIAPDASLPQHVHRRKATRKRLRLLVCETEEAKALNIAADLKNLFPETRFDLVPEVLRSARALPRVRYSDVVLVAPRIWGALSNIQRQQVVEIRYCIRPHELDSLGVTFGWERLAEEQVA
jgi:DNA-binding transcriptional regulator YhcF (GntR family)